MWVGVLEIGAVMAAVTLLTIDLYLPGGLIEGAQSLDNARTAGFTVLVFAQLFNCFNARSENTSAFHHLFVNPWLWGAIALSALLQVAVVQSRLPQPRLRHGAAEPSPVARLRRDGEPRAVVQRAAQGARALPFEAATPPRVRVGRRPRPDDRPRLAGRSVRLDLSAAPFQRRTDHGLAPTWRYPVSSAALTGSERTRAPALMPWSV